MDNPEYWAIGATPPSCASTPTSGRVMLYGYDNAGNVVTRIDPRNVQTAYTFDAANRLTNKTYSNCPVAGSCPAVSFGYDSLNRLTSDGAGTVSNTYQYDALGRMVSSAQTIDSVPYSFTYSYVPAGLSAMTYPSGRSVPYTFDAAGRTSSAGGYTAPSQNVTYFPHGAMKALALANASGTAQTVQQSWTVNSRLQVNGVTVSGTSNLLNIGLDYGTVNEGDLMRQTLTAGGATFTTAYTYDGIHRIQSAVETNGGQGWNQTFSEDTWGNAVLPGPTGYAALTFDSGTNRISSSGWAYDNAGGVVGMPAPWNATQTYDGAGRLYTYQATGGPTIQYVYDAQGRRVKSISATAGTTVFVHDGTGALAAEYGGSLTTTGRQYVFGDHLGSTRLVTDASGTVLQRLDYVPFGAAVTYSGCNQPAGPNRSPRCDVSGYGSDAGVRLQFTGKERDVETGLDFFGARYFSAAQGRFTSPDAPLVGQHPDNPQSWNLYSYGLNNPLRYLDPTGYDSEPADPESGEKGCGRDMKDCGPQIGAVPRPRSNGPLDRPIGAAKHYLVELIDTMSGGRPTEAAQDLMWFLRPRTDEEYNGGLGSDAVQAVMLPFAVSDLGKLITSHSFVKHVLVQGEFPGVRTTRQFEELVQSVLTDSKSIRKDLSGGRIAFWNDETSSVVIVNTKVPDKSTIFQPRASKAFFDGLK